MNTATNLQFLILMVSSPRLAPRAGAYGPYNLDSSNLNLPSSPAVIQSTETCLGQYGWVSVTSSTF